MSDNTNGDAAQQPRFRDANTIGRNGFGAIGVGAAACVACCVGPILGALAAIGLGTITGVLLFGTGGLFFAVVGGLWLWRRRGDGADRCGTSDQAVRVDAPTMKN